MAAHRPPMAAPSPRRSAWAPHSPVWGRCRTAEAPRVAAQRLARRSVSAEVVPAAAQGVLSVCWFAAKAYGFCLVAVFLLQRKLMFLPSGTVADPAAQGGSPDVVILPSGSAAAFFKPAAEDGPVLVFFHGNADQVGWGPAFLGVEFGRRYGFGLYAVEYPGYGLAKPGSPTEANINAAAEELITHLIREEKIAKSRLVLVGQSIGCAVAVEMARRGFGEKLILLSPFTSSKAIAEAVYPFLKPALRLVPQLVRDPFDNLGKAGELKLPTLVIHGTEDEVVPFDMGKQLSKAIDRAQFVPIHGTGHNDILDRLQVFEGIASFVRR